MFLNMSCLQPFACSVGSFAPIGRPPFGCRGSTKEIVEQFGAVGGSFWVREPATERVRVIYVHDGGRLLRGGDSEHPLAREEVPIPILVDRATGAELSAATMAEFEQRRDVPASVVAYLRHRSVKKLFGMRLVFGGDVLGGFTVYFTADRAFPEQEQILAKGLVMQATLALKLARMEEETRHAVVLDERNRMARDIHDTLAQGLIIGGGGAIRPRCRGRQPRGANQFCGGEFHFLMRSAARIDFGVQH